MAQNITLMGASYADVPSVELPKTGGGTASFTDTSPTTAAAADVAAGKYFFTANGVLTLGTSSGGVEDGHVWQDENGYIVVSDETGKVYQTISKSYTPTETAQSETITPSSGYDALSSVSVSVGAISSSYVGSGITRRSSTDLTASGATVTAPAGYYSSAASKSVASGSVSASASKGTVSNHSVSVTPTATVGTAGYLAAGSTSGTAVTVTASELVSGNKEITANGTNIDVADFSTVSVAVPTQSGGMSETDLKNFIQRTSGFTDIDWPDGLTTIGVYAFAQSSYFNPSALPNTITSIGSYAFYACGRLTLASLPDSVTSIGTNAFQHCTSLALTSLPSGLTNLGSSAFAACTQLALTSLPSGITSIAASVFSGCTNLALTSLPSGVRGTIYASAFYNCIGITISVIPSGVTSIGNYAFQGCSGITSIECDGVITSLAQNAFTGTSTASMNLVSASFPNMAMTSSMSNVFGHSTAAQACQLLEFCDIGSTVAIGSNAFENCYALETLVLRKTASVCTLANVNAFLNTPMRGYNSKTGTVYVPSALISSYQTATNWKTLYDDGTVTFEAIEGSDYELEE